MASAKDVLGVAYSQLGYHAPSDPEPGSKYGRWLAALWGEDWLAGPSDQVWWCCLFVSWCLDQAGQDCPGFPTFNTDLAIANGASSRLVDPYDAEPGDVLIFDWNWTNEATDHIGFCVENHGNGWLETIEGNVGNAVAEKTRDVALVRYCVRPWYDGSGTLPTTGLTREDNPDPGALEIDGILGNLSVTKWQRELVCCRNVARRPAGSGHHADMGTPSQMVRRGRGHGRGERAMRRPWRRPKETRSR